MESRNWWWGKFKDREKASSRKPENCEVQYSFYCCSVSNFLSFEQIRWRILDVKLLSLDVIFIFVRAKSKRRLVGRWEVHLILVTNCWIQFGLISFSFFYRFNDYLPVQSRIGKTTQNRQYSLLKTAILIRVTTLLSWYTLF